MKQTILSMFLLFAIISHSTAQKKANLKVYAYAYDNSGKYAKLEISNPNYPNTKVLVLKVWFKDALCFDAVEEMEVSEGVHLTLGCPNSYVKNTPLPMPYKGVALVLYTINGREKYYKVKDIKVVPIPKRDTNRVYDKKG